MDYIDRKTIDDTEVLTVDVQKMIENLIKEQVKKDYYDNQKEIIDNMDVDDMDYRQRTMTENTAISILKDKQDKGAQKYGQGIDHRDPYDWSSELIEELTDGLQYAVALRMDVDEKVLGHVIVAEDMIRKLENGGKLNGQDLNALRESTKRLKGLLTHDTREKID